MKARLGSTVPFWPRGPFGRATTSLFWIDTRSQLYRYAGLGQIPLLPANVEDPFTTCKLLKLLERGNVSPRLILSFPHASTRKSHPPQFLHKSSGFLCCEAQQSG